MKLLFVAAVASLIATPSFAGAAQYTASYESKIVYRTDGKALGTDPDVRVRFELLRDAYADEN